MLKLSEALEEHDDVQNVYSNFDVRRRGSRSFGISDRRTV